MNQDFRIYEKRLKLQIKQRNSCICCLIGFSLILLTLIVLLFSLLYYIAAISYDQNNSINHHDNLLPADSNIRRTIQRSHLRLSNDIKPIKYDLILHPNLQNGSLNGRVNILINITTDDVHEIRIHGKYLIFDDVKLFPVKILTNGDDVNNKKNSSSIDWLNTTPPIVKVLDYMENIADEIWLIKLSNFLIPDIYELIIVYHSSVKQSNKLVGFYKSVYRNKETNETR